MPAFLLTALSWLGTAAIGWFAGDVVNGVEQKNVVNAVTGATQISPSAVTATVVDAMKKQTNRITLYFILFIIFAFIAFVLTKFNFFNKFKRR